MLIPVQDILDFHSRRTKCHINCMNYYAGLLGAHFPEHDNDKMYDPCRTGYAYINYANYHPDCTILPAQTDAYNAARVEHHKTQPHHIEHYENTSDIPDIRITEIVADWHSANFEQFYVQHQKVFYSVWDFFEREMSHLNWTTHQTDKIQQYIEIIQKTADFDTVMDIWDDIK